MPATALTAGFRLGGVGRQADHTTRSDNAKLGLPPKSAPTEGWPKARPLHSPRLAAAAPSGRGLQAAERCAGRRSRTSQVSVRAAISWSSGGLLSSGRYDPARWPHPYHGSAAKRRANPRFRSSRSTVDAAVMGSVAGPLLWAMLVGAARPATQAFPAVELQLAGA